jgi:hypothetical protein
MSLILKQTSHKSTGDGPRAVLDADSIAFACAAAADGRGYKIEGETFKYKNEAVDYCTQHAIDKEKIEEVYEPDPVSWALHSVDEMMLSVLNAVGTDNYTVYLTEGKNFRHKMFPEYKANRLVSGMRIPEHLKDCKEHLKVKWDGRSVDNIEADDAVRIDAVNDPSCIVCHIDKDLDMIQGWHFNWNTGELYFIDGSTALRNFYTQMIVGDTSDGIQGLSKKKPQKRTYKTKPLQDMQFYDDMEWYVYCGYVDRYGEEKAYDEMLMNGRLLYLLTSMDDTWEITI